MFSDKEGLGIKRVHRFWAKKGTFIANPSFKDLAFQNNTTTHRPNSDKKIVELKLRTPWIAFNMILHRATVHLK